MICVLRVLRTAAACDAIHILEALEAARAGTAPDGKQSTNYQDNKHPETTRLVMLKGYGGVNRVW